jgi:ElaB/YqjD/DUF883 family membrane-anchored ribosome-binding protein
MNRAANTKHRHPRRQEYDFYADIDHIREAVYDATRNARGKASKILAKSIENAKHKSKDLKGNVEDYVEKKPLQSVGIALLAGMFLGLILRK